MHAEEDLVSAYSHYHCRQCSTAVFATVARYSCYIGRVVTLKVSADNDNNNKETLFGHACSPVPTTIRCRKVVISID
jgi:hypothetical protein